MALLTTIILLLATPAVLFSPAEAAFSADLIHRDHPKSPLHIPTETRYERQRRAFLRSFSRAKYLRTRISNSKLLDTSPESIHSVITSGSGEYLMEAAIGTPPFTIQAIADTGSDLTWTQCGPCTKCYKQTAPFFKPSTSTTYQKLTCDEKQCQNLQQTTCDETNHCQYHVSYGDSSSSSGDLAAETLTFRSSSGSNASIPAVAIGCGYNNYGTFNESGSGIIGLGGGPLSIIRQMEKFIHGRFSYCLVSPFSSSTSSSKISFGPSAAVSGPGTVSATLYKKEPDTFYYLNLEGVSLANATSPSNRKTIPVSSEDPGNIIIDSGTTLTFLQEDVYHDLASAVQGAVSFATTEDSEGLLKLCFQASLGEGGGGGLPDLVVHFTGGADVVVPASSAFVEVSDEVTCLTFIPSADVAIFGNMAQENYYIGYDLQGGKVSFQATDCSKTG